MKGKSELHETSTRNLTATKDYYLFDGLRSIVGLIKSSSNEVNAYAVMLNETRPADSFQDAGGYFESSTGLYKFGTRYYAPSLGRWTQQDPVGGSLGDLNAANRYTYANDDPVNVVDPSGKYTFAQWWFVLGSCLASSVIAPFLALATLLGVGAALWAAIAAIASATAPAWLPWVVLVGGALLFGAVLGCAAFATLNTWRFFE